MPDHIDRFLDALDLEVDINIERMDRAQLAQLASIRRLIRRQQEELMATLTEVQDLVTLTGQDAQAAADRVLAAIADATASAAAQIADLQAQVQTLIDGNASDITPEQLQGLADGLTGVDTTIKGIAPDATPPA